MIKIVCSIGAFHEEYVAEDVDKLQRAGYVVTKIVRVKKMFLGLFGQHVTHIYYEAL